MRDNETSRLSRLTAILLLLQSKRLVTSTFIAKKFDISIRTVYRDMKSLEEAGVPVVTEEGKGYTLMEGYNLPPVMFNEEEANALITAGQLVATNKDKSFVNNYVNAITKIKAVLKYGAKDKVDLLSERVIFRINPHKETTSHYLSDIQLAITNFNVIEINYSAENDQVSKRKIEPLGLYSTQENWILVAFCRMRKENRAFRLDRIKTLTLQNENFAASNFTLQEYFEECKAKSNFLPLT